jgi:hypothetical protein
MQPADEPASEPNPTAQDANDNATTWPSTDAIEAEPSSATNDDAIGSEKSFRDKGMAVLAKIAREVAATCVVPTNPGEEGRSASNEVGRVDHEGDSGEGPGAAARLVPIALALMTSSECMVVEIPLKCVAAFLNNVGDKALEHGLVDVQFWPQRRSARRDPDPEIWGVTLDVDLQVADPFGSLMDAGLPPPTAWWRTKNGWKAVWMFDRAIDRASFHAIAQQYTLFIVGGDPKSWSPEQAQHLPTVHKTTPDGLVIVQHKASQSNTQPMIVDEFEPELPTRIERALSAGGRLSAGERQVVEDYLLDLGTPAPDERGGRSSPYDRCPASEQHDRPCLYVMRRDDGFIHLTCYGGHGGEGEKRWTEIALFELATGKRLDDDGIVALRDIPMTWAGAEYVKPRLQELFASEDARDVLVGAAIHVWFRAHAATVLARAKKRAATENVKLAPIPAIEQFVNFYQSKIDGFDQTGSCSIAFDAASKSLRILRGDGSTDEIKSSGE